MARGEHDVPAGAVVRVHRRDGEVVGGGFLVGPGAVATCAHVVADALGADAYDPAPPGGAVRLDFPLLDRSAGGPADDPGDGEPPAVTARVERWLPIAGDGSGDVAILRVDGPLPEGARMPPLRRVDRLWDHGFRVLGFPDGARDGVWTTGRIRGEQGTGWFQLQGHVGEQPVEGGFSGAPVWHDGSGAVVGMTVAADRGATTTAYLVPIDEVIGADPELLPNPYRGLAPFEEEHSALFFGRGPDIERLVDAVDRHPVVAVAGPSGAGKSSLVRAGLLPRLRARGTHVLDVPAAPGTAPALPADTPAPTVVVVDQFEELAALDPPAARALLQDLVARSGEDRRVVLTVRWSALDDLLTPDLAAVLEAGTVLVAPLDRPRLRETIVGPAERAPGLAFEDGLVDRILDDAGAEPGQLPLVESLLAALWEHRDGGYLTLAGYAAAGGVGGSVARHADQVVAAVGADEEDLRRLFTMLARPDRDGRFARHPVPLADLPGPLAALVPPLAAGRLLVVGRAGRDTVELAHQALVEHWPRLRDWLVADREFLAWRAALEVQRERWEATGRDQGALLRGAALAGAAEWLPARAPDVSAAARDYVHRSTQRQRRDVRRWRSVTAVLAVLVLAAGVLAAVAVQRGNDVAAQLATANAELLGRESIARAGSDGALAAQLALAAWHTDPDSPQARTALAGAYLALQSADAVYADVTGGPVTDIVPAGTATMLLREDAGPVILSGPAGPTGGPPPLRWEPPEVGFTTAADLSGDGRLFVAAAPGGGVRIWDVATRSIVRTLPAAGEARALVLSPAADRVGWVAETGDPAGMALTIAETATGRLLPHGLGPVSAEGLAGFWLPPDPQRILLRYGPSELEAGQEAGPEDRVVIRSLADGAEVARLSPDVRVIGGGAAVASCAALQGDALSRLEVTVTPMGPGAAWTVPTVNAWSCQDLQVGARTQVLVEAAGTAQGRDQDLLQLTDLTDGRAYQVSVPRGAGGSAGTGSRMASISTVGLARSPGAPPAVVALHGTSLLRLHGDPMPPRVRGVARWRYETADGRHSVVRRGATFTVTDRATGEVLGTRTFDEEPAGLNWMVNEAIWMLEFVGGRWQITRYDLPTLAPAYTITPPAGDPQRTAWIPAFGSAGDTEPIVYLGEGLLTAWDRATGRPIGAPVDIGRTPTWSAFDQRIEIGWPRPGHGAQFAFLTPDLTVQVWDAATGARVGTLPATADETGDLRFDTTGKRMAVLTAVRTIEIWDVDTATQVRPPIAAPDVDSLVGFDEEGHLLVRSGDLATVDVIDVVGGFVTGSLGLPNTAESQLYDERSISTDTSTSELPLIVPLDAGEWFARLCAVAARPYTAAEAALLPAGVGTSPPCSGD